MAVGGPRPRSTCGETLIATAFIVLGSIERSVLAAVSHRFAPTTTVAIQFDFRSSPALEPVTIILIKCYYLKLNCCGQGGVGLWIFFSSLVALRSL
jgi:hypothetical protein